MVMDSSRDGSKKLVLTTEIFSVRTDIPSAMVLCALRGRLRRACLLRRQQGEPTLPPTAHTVRLPLLCTCVSGISKERICPKPQVCPSPPTTL